MKLTRQVVITVTVTVSALLLLNGLVIQNLLKSTFERYEDAHVARNSGRIQQSIEATYERLTRTNLDWSEWTDTYNFLLGNYADYVNANLVNGSLENIGLDLMAFADGTHQVVWHKWKSNHEAFDAPGELYVEHSEAIEKLFNEFANEDVDSRGIVLTSRGPLFVVSRPVVRNDRSGPPAGTLLTGLYIDESWIADTSRRAHVDFSVVELSDMNHGEEIDDIQEQLAAQDGAPLVFRSDSFVHEYFSLSDIGGDPALLIDVLTPRDIFAQGRQVQYIAAGSAGIAGLTLMILITMLIRRLVVQPIHELTGHIERIKETGELRSLAESHSKDEVGLLALKFDELIQKQKQAEDKSQLLDSILQRTSISIAFTDSEGCLQYMNPTFANYLCEIGYSDADFDIQHLFDAQGQTSDAYDQMSQAIAAGSPWSSQVTWTDSDEIVHEEEMTISPVRSLNNEVLHLYIYYQDVTTRNALERRLAQAEKLESVGQLASGIAHEINTPAQFVGDNTKFLQESFEDLNDLLQLLDQLATSDRDSVSMDKIRLAVEKADVRFLSEEIPSAIEQSIDGIARISTIVRAMKDFAHPGTELAQVDINRAIESTVTVASNEWKYVADVNLKLDDALPEVQGNVGQINQVLLNIIVNASHAIAENGKDTQGIISIETGQADSCAEICISDNGPGIPEDVRARIFDPFFTTKEVGKGTGQGLSIAYDVVVNKHGGTISAESEPGQGSRFIIRLPICVDDKAA